MDIPNTTMETNLVFDNDRDNYFRMFGRMGKSTTKVQIKEN